MTLAFDKEKNLRISIGRKLRIARIEKKLSQDQLAKKIGLTHAGIGSYERGKLRINIQLLVSLSEALEKPIYYFLEENQNIVEKYKKEKDDKNRLMKGELPEFNMLENLEFSMEMSIRAYLKAHGIRNDLSDRVEQVMDLVKTIITSRN